MTSQHERDTRRRFEERYAVPTSDVTEEVERCVIGADVPFDAVVHTVQRIHDRTS